MLSAVMDVGPALEHALPGLSDCTKGRQPSSLTFASSAGSASKPVRLKGPLFTNSPLALLSQEILLTSPRYRVKDIIIKDLIFMKWRKCNA